MAEFILQQKISRMTLKSYGRIANFRKPEKYTLGAEIQATEIRMLRLAILANKSRTSKRQHYQFELDAELDRFQKALEERGDFLAEKLVASWQELWNPVEEEE